MPICPYTDCDRITYHGYVGIYAVRGTSAACEVYPSTQVRVVPTMISSQVVYG
jgi:hypothetical protein